MTTHSDPNIATAPVGWPAQWTLLWQWRWQFARRRLACLLRGHEKWTEEGGDWSCTRCGKIVIRDR